MLNRKELLSLVILFIILLVITIKTIYSSPEEFCKKLAEDTQISLRYGNENTPQKEGEIVMLVNDKKLFEKVASNGEVGLADSYIDGDWDSDDLEETISYLLSNRDFFENKIKKQSFNFIFMELKTMIKNIFDNNTIQSSKSNISHHYDIGNDLYEKMLGKHMQYTCAYFNQPNMTLDEAQYAKMELIAKKLDLKPNMKVLDIGCGFGSMAQHLAINYDVYVIGITLSKEQISYYEEHFSHPKVTIMLKDYRHVTGNFDRVYSVGCFEHVGRNNYKKYYDKCYELLNPDGIMLIHTIGTNASRKWSHNSFLNKYIFPGAEPAHIENLTQHFIDQWHLEDWQNMGLSYAKTLRGWYKNIGDWSGLEHYDERFRRIWDFYLLGCAATFQIRDTVLWQIVYTKRNSNREDDCHHIRN